jgi:hypothetical protein
MHCGVFLPFNEKDFWKKKACNISFLVRLSLIDNYESELMLGSP